VRSTSQCPIEERETAWQTHMLSGWEASTEVKGGGEQVSIGSRYSASLGSGTLRRSSVRHPSAGPAFPWVLAQASSGVGVPRPSVPR
jgi:hypothetical protein